MAAPVVSGVMALVAQVNPKTGKISGALFVTQDVDQIVITSKSAQVINLPLRNIPQIGRATQGVILMRFSTKGDQVAAVTDIKKEEVE